MIYPFYSSYRSDWYIGNLSYNNTVHLMPTVLSYRYLLPNRCIAPFKLIIGTYLQIRELSAEKRQVTNNNFFPMLKNNLETCLTTISTNIQNCNKSYV